MYMPRSRGLKKKNPKAKVGKVDFAVNEEIVIEQNQNVDHSHEEVEAEKTENQHAGNANEDDGKNKLSPEKQKTDPANTKGERIQIPRS